MGKLRLAAGLVVALAVVVAVALVLNGCKPATQATDVKAMTPPTYAGFLKEQKLAGQVALIQFGQVGCEMSGQEYQQMVKMNRDKTIANLCYLRVDATPKKKDAEAYFKENPAGFAVARDEDGKLATEFDVLAVPTVVLVDKFGRVRYRGGSLPPEGQLTGWVAALCREESDGGPDVALLGGEKINTKALVKETQLPDLGGTVKPLAGYMGEKGMVVVFADVRCPFAGVALGDLPKVVPKLATLGLTTVVVNISDPKDAVTQKYEVEVIESTTTAEAKPEDLMTRKYKTSNTGTPVVYDVTTVTKRKWRIDMVPTVFLLGTDGGQSYRAGAVWKDLAAAVEQAQGLPAGSVQFEAEGTGHG